MCSKTGLPGWFRSTYPHAGVAVLILVAAFPLNCRAAARPPSIALNYRVQVMLIKNALTAVNHGNLTGNYTVLRDLASDAFRKRNTASQLATIFANHRQQGFDLSPILVSEPQFTRQPAEVQPGRLQLVGFFPTQPQAVEFALVYQRTPEGWMIDEVSVGMAPLEAIMKKMTTPSAAPVVAMPPSAAAEY